MESVYENLAPALRQRLAVISDRSLREKDFAAHLTALQAASEEIAALLGQLPPNTDPQLPHFLERCSYDKALIMHRTARRECALVERLFCNDRSSPQSSPREKKGEAASGEGNPASSGQENGDPFGSP